MSKSAERKIGATLSYIVIFLNTIIGIAYTPFLTRMLGQSEYGLYSLINSIIGYLTVLDFGFGNAIVIYTARYNERKDYEGLNKLYGMFLKIYSIISVIAVILGILLYFSAGTIFEATMTAAELEKAKIMILILTLNLAITFPFSVYSSIITAHEKFIFKKTLIIIRTALNPLVMIPLLLNGYKSISLVIVVTTLNILTLISNYYYCKKKLKIKIKYSNFEKKIFKEIFAYSIFIFLNVIVDKINWSLDQFILGAVAGTTQVAIYSVASQFNSMYISFPSAISGVLLPKITKMIENKASDDEITEEFVKTSRIQYFILFLIITGFIIFGKEFILLFFGKEYTTSYYTALILMIPITIHLTQGVGLSILQAKNLHKFRSIMLIIVSILNLFISIPLGKMYGSIGTAIGTGIALIIGDTIIMNIYYKKKAGISINKYWTNMINMTLKLILPVILIIVIMNIPLNLPSLIEIIIFGIIYIIIYCLYSYFIVMNEYEITLIQKPLQKISKVFKRKKK